MKSFCKLQLTYSLSKYCYHYFNISTETRKTCSISSHISKKFNYAFIDVYQEYLLYMSRMTYKLPAEIPKTEPYCWGLSMIIVLQMLCCFFHGDKYTSNKKIIPRDCLLRCDTNINSEHFNSILQYLGRMAAVL